MSYKYCFYLVPMLSVLFAGCASAPNETTQAVSGDSGGQFVGLRYSSSTPLVPGPGRPAAGPQLQLALSLTGMNYPEDQAKFFHEILYSGLDLEAYRDRVADGQTEDYRQMLNVLEDPDMGISESLNWHYTEEVSVEGAGNDGIVVERALDFYAGGAHGLNTKSYYVLDLEARRVVTIDDLFPNYQDERIKAIIYDALREFSGLAKGQPLSEGEFFSDEPELTDNFYVTAQGLGLYWNHYEIAPYSSGPIEVLIPWRDIRPLMLHSGMELLVKFRIYLFM